MLFLSYSLTLFAMGEGTHVPAEVSFVCCGRIRDLEKVWNFQRIPKIYEGFWIKKIFLINFAFSGSGSFVRTLVVSWSMSKFFQQKLNLQVTYCLLTGYFCFKYNNVWLHKLQEYTRIHKLHQCKQFQMIFGKQVLLYV